MTRPTLASICTLSDTQAIRRPNLVPAQPRTRHKSAVDLFQPGEQHEWRGLPTRADDFTAYRCWEREVPVLRGNTSVS